MNRVTVKREMLQWARERAGRSLEALAGKFPKLPQWERGEAWPTLKQLELFARATFVPVGYLFLREPPVERLPVPDMRTTGERRAKRPSGFRCWFRRATCAG